MKKHTEITFFSVSPVPLRCNPKTEGNSPRKMRRAQSSDKLNQTVLATALRCRIG